ncbi:ribosomal protein S5 domain 2-type protein, partial [Gautieria morchelliformis]
LRPIDIVFESLDRVDGSASFAFGPTKALASVSGPIQVRLPAEQPSKATFEVLARPLSGISDTDAKSFSTVLRTLLVPCLVLTQNPRTLIQLVVQSLTSTTPNQDPSLAAAFINASSLALLQASAFPMLGVVCAAAVGHIKRHHSEPELNSERFLLDPNAQEIRECDAVGCVAVMFRSRNTSSLR